MDVKQLRFLAYTGISAVMVMSIWYVLKSYGQGRPNWYFLILAISIGILLTYNLLTFTRRK